MGALLAWAFGFLLGGVAGIFGWLRLRRDRVEAQENPLPEAELQALRLRVSALHTSPVKQRLRDNLKAHEDWRWAARQERAALVMTLMCFGVALALVLVAVVVG